MIELHLAFQLSKANPLKMADLIKEGTEFHSNSGSKVTPMQRVTLTISFFAGASFNMVLAI